MVRIVEVIATAHPDSTTEDTKWEYVVIKAIKPVNRPVTLEQIKTHPEIEKNGYCEKCTSIGAAHDGGTKAHHLFNGRSHGLIINAILSDGSVFYLLRSSLLLRIKLSGPILSAALVRPKRLYSSL